TIASRAPRAASKNESGRSPDGTLCARATLGSACGRAIVRSADRRGVTPPEPRLRHPRCCAERPARHDMQAARIPRVALRIRGEAVLWSLPPRILSRWYDLAGSE